jgi:hypothetical protein
MPVGDHQIIERNLADAGAWGGGLNRAGSNIDAGDLRQKDCDVSLLRLELTDWRSDFGGREDGGCHLIEQRLKNVVVAPIDHDDLDIGMSQRVRRCDPGKAGADDHDTLALSAGRSRVRPDLFQHSAHESPHSCSLS